MKGRVEEEENMHLMHGKCVDKNKLIVSVSEHAATRVEQRNGKLISFSRLHCDYQRLAKCDVHDILTKIYFISNHRTI